MKLKKALILSITGLSLLVLSVGQVRAADKVTICHTPSAATPQTMEVPEAALDGHLGHGDTLGACPAPVVPEFGLVTGILALAASAGSFIILKRKKQV